MYINCNDYADAWTGEFDFVLILLFNIMFNSIQNDYSLNISWDGSCRSGCSSVENLGPSTKISRGAILLQLGNRLYDCIVNWKRIKINNWLYLYCRSLTWCLLLECFQKHYVFSIWALVSPSDLLPLLQSPKRNSN